MKITSKSLLPKFKTFSLDYFKKPFFYKEIKKKYKLYEMPKFKSSFFNNKKYKKDLTKKCIFISGPARSGNHLLLSLLDNHPQIDFEVGEDDMLRTIFSHAKLNEKNVIRKLNSGDINYILKLSGQPKYGRGYGINKWKKLYELYVSKKKLMFGLVTNQKEKPI